MLNGSVVRARLPTVQRVSFPHIISEYCLMDSDTRLISLVYLLLTNDISHMLWKGRNIVCKIYGILKISMKT